MKKILCFLAVLVMMLVIGMTAIAEAPAVAEAPAGTAVVAEEPLPVDPFDWTQLATIAGATLATLLIVQLLKLPLDKVWKIPTRIVVYVIALIIMTAATYFTSGLTWSSFALVAVNAVIVALAAMGSYELTFAKYDAKKRALAN